MYIILCTVPTINHPAPALDARIDERSDQALVTLYNCSRHGKLFVRVGPKQLHLHFLATRLFWALASLAYSWNQPKSGAGVG